MIMRYISDKALTLKADFYSQEWSKLLMHPAMSLVSTNAFFFYREENKKTHGFFIRWFLVASVRLKSRLV